MSPTSSSSPSSRQSAVPEPAALLTGITRGVLLLIAMRHLLAIEIDASVSKVQPLSVFGMFAPGGLIGSTELFELTRWLAFVVLLYWTLGCFIGVPRIVFLLAPTLFCLASSLAIETQYFTRHQPHFCCIGLFLFGYAQFRASIKRISAPKLIAIPTWVHFLFTAYICISYTYSALTKLAFSGIGWGNGTSLMLWIELHAIYRDTALFQFTTSQPFAAMLMQNVTLIAELGCIAALFMPPLRVVLGSALVGFHISVELLFGYGFTSNIVLDASMLVLFYFLPGYRMTPSEFFRLWLGSSQPARIQTA